MKISKLLLLCAFFGAAQVLNGAECSQIGTVQYKQNGVWREFEITDQYNSKGQRLNKLDCSYVGARCRPMGGDHKENIARIDALVDYMNDEFKVKNKGISEWFAWNRASAGICEFKP